MKDKKKILKLMGVAVSSTALAFLAYKGYNKYKKYKQEVKDLEKELEERKTLMEVKQIVEEENKRAIEQFHEDQKRSRDEILKMQASQHEEVEYYRDEEEIEDDSDDIVEFVSWRDLQQSIEEEEIVLKYEPESIAALSQYKMMKLAGIGLENERLRDMLFRLFDIEYVAKCEDDVNLYSTLIYEREDFFGEGKYTKNVTYAELLLHFADSADFDLDIHPDKLLTDMLRNIDIHVGTGTYTLEERLESVARHEYYFRDFEQYGEQEMFGIFALSPAEVDSMSNEMSVNDDHGFQQQYNAWIYNIEEGY